MSRDKNTEEKVYDDRYLKENIVACRSDESKAHEVYRKYVGAAATPEERLRRINEFRCGGR